MDEFKQIQNRFQRLNNHFKNIIDSFYAENHEKLFESLDDVGFVISSELKKFIQDYEQKENQMKIKYFMHQKNPSDVFIVLQFLRFIYQQKDIPNMKNEFIIMTYLIKTMKILVQDFDQNEYLQNIEDKPIVSFDQKINQNQKSQILEEWETKYEQLMIEQQNAQIIYKTDSDQIFVESQTNFQLILDNVQPWDENEEKLFKSDIFIVYQEISSLLQMILLRQNNYQYLLKQKAIMSEFIQIFQWTFSFKFIAAICNTLIYFEDFREKFAENLDIIWQNQKHQFDNFYQLYKLSYITEHQIDKNTFKLSVQNFLSHFENLKQHRQKIFDQIMDLQKLHVQFKNPSQEDELILVEALCNIQSNVSIFESSMIINIITNIYENLSIEQTFYLDFKQQLINKLFKFTLHFKDKKFTLNVINYFTQIFIHNQIESSNIYEDLQKNLLSCLRYEFKLILSTILSVFDQNMMIEMFLDFALNFLESNLPKHQVLFYECNILSALIVQLKLILQQNISQYHDAKDHKILDLITILLQNKNNMAVFEKFLRVENFVQYNGSYATKVQQILVFLLAQGVWLDNFIEYLSNNYNRNWNILDKLVLNQEQTLKLAISLLNQPLSNDNYIEISKYWKIVITHNKSLNKYNGLFIQKFSLDNSSHIEQLLQITQLDNGQLQQQIIDFLYTLIIQYEKFSFDGQQLFLQHLYDLVNSRLYDNIIILLQSGCLQLLFMQCLKIRKFQEIILSILSYDTSYQSYLQPLIRLMLRNIETDLQFSEEWMQILKQKLIDIKRIDITGLLFGLHELLQMKISRVLKPEEFSVFLWFKQISSRSDQFSIIKSEIFDLSITKSDLMLICFQQDPLQIYTDHFDIQQWNQICITGLLKNNSLYLNTQFFHLNIQDQFKKDNQDVQIGFKQNTPESQFSIGPMLIFNRYLSESAVNGIYCGSDRFGEFQIRNQTIVLNNLIMNQKNFDLITKKQTEIIPINLYENLVLELNNSKINNDSQINFQKDQQINNQNNKNLIVKFNGNLNNHGLLSRQLVLNNCKLIETLFFIGNQQSELFIKLYHIVALMALISHSTFRELCQKINILSSVLILNAWQFKSKHDIRELSVFYTKNFSVLQNDFNQNFHEKGTHIKIISENNFQILVVNRMFFKNLLPQIQIKMLKYILKKLMHAQNYFYLQNITIMIKVKFLPFLFELLLENYLQNYQELIYQIIFRILKTYDSNSIQICFDILQSSYYFLYTKIDFKSSIMTQAFGNTQTQKAVSQYKDLLQNCTKLNEIQEKIYLMLGKLIYQLFQKASLLEMNSENVFEIVTPQKLLLFYDILFKKKQFQPFHDLLEQERLLTKAFTLSLIFSSYRDSICDDNQTYYLLKPFSCDFIFIRYFLYSALKITITVDHKFEKIKLKDFPLLDVKHAQQIIKLSLKLLKFSLKCDRMRKQFGIKKIQSFTFCVPTFEEIIQNLIIAVKIFNKCVNFDMSTFQLLDSLKQILKMSNYVEETNQKFQLFDKHKELMILNLLKLGLFKGIDVFKICLGICNQFNFDSYLYQKKLLNEVVSTSTPKSIFQNLNFQSDFVEFMVQLTKKIIYDDNDVQKAFTHLTEFLWNFNFVEIQFLNRIHKYLETIIILNLTQKKEKSIIQDLIINNQKVVFEQEFITENFSFTLCYILWKIIKTTDYDSERNKSLEILFILNSKCDFSKMWVFYDIDAYTGIMSNVQALKQTEGVVQILQKFSQKNVIQRMDMVADQKFYKLFKSFTDECEKLYNDIQNKWIIDSPPFSKTQKQEQVQQSGLSGTLQRAIETCAIMILKTSNLESLLHKNRLKKLQNHLLYEQLSAYYDIQEDQLINQNQLKNIIKENFTYGLLPRTNNLEQRLIVTLQRKKLKSKKTFQQSEQTVDIIQQEKPINQHYLASLRFEIELGIIEPITNFYEVALIYQKSFRNCLFLLAKNSIYLVFGWGIDQSNLPCPVNKIHQDSSYWLLDQQVIPQENIQKIKIKQISFLDIITIQPNRNWFKPCRIDIKTLRKTFLIITKQNQRDHILESLKGIKLKKNIPFHELKNMWIQGQISNYQYTSFLNQAAGRSVFDLSQYPVFPWILTEDNDDLQVDLNNSKNFRNLSKPLGALTKEKQQKSIEKYNNCKQTDLPYFHYGSHYSVPVLVLYYLIRLQPFADLSFQLQGSSFDLSDRIFDNLNKQKKKLMDTYSETRELIPELFYLAEMMINLNEFQFGQTQTGKNVDDVDLPQWTFNNPRQFTIIHQKAMESQYVSAKINQWIDLIFGFKQNGQHAVESINVYYYMTYEGNVDINKDQDTSTRTALLDQINEFGQIPKKLFSWPHPQKLMNRKCESFFYSLDKLLKVKSKVIKCYYGKQITQIKIRDQNDLQNNLCISQRGNCLLNDDAHILSWKNSLKKVVLIQSHNDIGYFSIDSKGISLIQPGQTNIENEFYIAIGSIYGNINLYLIKKGKQNENNDFTKKMYLKFYQENIPYHWIKQSEQGFDYQIQIINDLKGHSSQVTTIQFLKSYNLLLSGDSNSSICIFDLLGQNRLLRKIYTQHNIEQINLKNEDFFSDKKFVNFKKQTFPLIDIQICQKNGDFIALSQHHLSLYTVNGTFLARFQDDNIQLTSCQIIKNSYLIEDNYIFLGDNYGGIRILIMKLIKNQQNCNQFKSNYDSPKNSQALYQLEQIIWLQNSGKGSAKNILISENQKYMISSNDHGEILQWYVEDPPVINCCQFCAKSVKNKKQKCIYCNKLACEICFDKKFIPAIVEFVNLHESTLICKMCYINYIQSIEKSSVYTNYP